MTVATTRLRNFAVTAAAVALLGSAATAEAQQTRVSGGQFRQHTVEDTTLNQQGRIELGVNLAGAMSFGSVSVEGGEDHSQKSLYMAPSLVGGYMLLDNVELRLTVGATFLNTEIDGVTTQDSLIYPLSVQGLYQKDFILGLAGYAGVGLGGFYGGREVPGGAAGTSLSYTQYGGLAQVLLGLMAMPGPRLLLRGGLRVDTFFGSENPDFNDPPANDRSFFNVQVLFEAAIGIRLG